MNKKKIKRNKSNRTEDSPTFQVAGSETLAKY